MHREYHLEFEALAGRSLDKLSIDKKASFVFRHILFVGYLTRLRRALKDLTESG